MADVNLDDFSKLEQRSRLIERFGPFPGRQDETGGAQLFATGQDFVCRRCGFENFQDNRMWWGGKALIRSLKSNPLSTLMNPW